MLHAIYRRKKMIEEGMKAPPFTLPDKDGNEISLESYRGSYVLVYFYPKDNTPGCTAEACSIRDTMPAFSEIGLTVLGISADSAESHRKFSDKYSLGFTLLTDKDHATMEAYGAYGEKMMYGKKTVGVIRSSFLIAPDGTIAKVWKKVNTKTHGEDVRKALEEIKGR